MSKRRTLELDEDTHEMLEELRANTKTGSLSEAVRHAVDMMKALSVDTQEQTRKALLESYPRRRGYTKAV